MVLSPPLISPRATNCSRRLLKQRPAGSAFPGKLLEGEFQPSTAITGSGAIRKCCVRPAKSLARLRREIEPVEQATFVSFTTRWQGVTVPRRGLDALLDTVEALQGSAILASELETEILPARIADYQPAISIL